MPSFSKDTKEELYDISKLKKCCYFSIFYAFSLFFKDIGDCFVFESNNKKLISFLKDDIEYAFKTSPIVKNNDYLVHIRKDVIKFSTIAEIKNNILKCDNCRNMFLRTIFLISGSVSDPNKSYRLELVFKNEVLANEIKDFLKEIDYVFLSSRRNNTYILYTKKSETVKDFLAYIGATKAYFKFIDCKILKEVRNEANRASNCDSANINKMLDASKKYNKAIRYLLKTGDYELLSPDLKETAKLKIENNEITFQELGKQLNPPISKSGVYHRLERIYAVYLSLKSKK